MKEYFKISQLLAKNLEGDLSASEQKFLEDWLSESEGNRKLYQNLNIDKVRNTALKEIEYFNGTKEKAKQKLVREIGVSKDHRLSQPGKLIRVLMTAAAVAILVVVSTWFVLQINKVDTSPTATVLSIPAGSSKATLTMSGGEKIQLGEDVSGFVIVDRSVGQEITKEGDHLSYYANDKDLSLDYYSMSKDIPYNILEVPVQGEYNLVLSDGTKVFLNAESKIKYPVRFAKDKRYVEVEGEVFFEVAHNSDWPFVVKDNRGNMTNVLGTSFNVRSYSNESVQKVTLVDGSVMFESVRGDKKQLTPGNAAIYHMDDDKLTVEEVDLDEVLGWKSGRFIYNNDPLSEILYAMSRWYGIDVRYASKELKEIRFSVDFKRTKDLSVLLKSFEMTESVQFEFNEIDKLLIVRKK